MKILVLNGSPKGKQSTTMKYVTYLETNFSEIAFSKYDLAKNIKTLKRNDDAFNGLIELVKGSDAIIWAFPVYICFVPSEVKQFIELIFEKHVEDIFTCKHATAISTSAKFYDFTAHEYIHEISEDLGMFFYKGFSAKFLDLMDIKHRKTLLGFFENFCNTCKEKRIIRRTHPPLQPMSNIYEPNDNIKDVEKTLNHKVIILTDVSEKDTSLRNMIRTFTKLCPFRNIEVINVNDITMKGGCIGCTKCTYDLTCFQKDDHNEIFKKTLDARVIINAFMIKDRYLSARVKQYQDRVFFNGHRPMFEGRQEAWILSGSFRQLPNLRTIIEGSSEIGRGNLVGIVTDEDDSRTIESLLKNLVTDVTWSLEHDHTRPRTFLGEGGHKIFRDLIHEFQVIFKHDHEYFKKEKLYDFPKKKYRTLSLLRPFMKSKRFREKYFKFSAEFLLKQFDKVIKKELGTI